MLVSFLLSDPPASSRSDSVSNWYAKAMPFADRFFALSETFDSGANGHAILSLLTGLNDLRVKVDETAYPRSLRKPRTQLLSAMEATLYAMTDSLIREHQSADDHRRQARRSLNAFRSRTAALGIE